MSMDINIKTNSDGSTDVKVKTNLRELKSEISKKASMANKRLKRLEKNGLTDLPSYKNWVTYNGGVKFSVKGKNYNELKSELARVNNFIDNQTSTVRGANKYLKNIADTVGLKYDRVSDLKNSTSNFFELVSKVGQYMDSTAQIAQAMGYQKMWEVVNNYLQENAVDLSDSIEDVDDMIEDISEMMHDEYTLEVARSISDSFTELD